MKKYKDVFIVLVSGLLFLSLNSCAGPTESGNFPSAATATVHVVVTRPPATTTSIPAATLISHVDLPAWVSDPAGDVLLLATSDESKTRSLVLVNASSQEVWAFPGMHTFDAFFWSPDGKQIGVIVSDDELILLDTLTGDMAHLPAGEHLTRLEGNYHDALIAWPVPGDPTKFILHPWYWSKNRISSDGRYLVEQDKGETTIIHMETGERIPITRAEDELDDYLVEWSPVGPYLAVAQADEPSSMYLWFEKVPNFTLKIYDADGRLVSKYLNVTFPRWSPDGVKFLYQPLDLDQHMFWGSAPCVYDTLTNETRCFNDISVRHPAENYASLQWLPDGDRFGYVYNHYDIEDSRYYGGLCFITISDGSEECVLQAGVGGLNPIRYLPSPDGRYISAWLTDSSPLSDDIGRWALVVADVETGESFVVEGTSRLYTYDMGLWRPRLTDRD